MRGGKVANDVPFSALKVRYKSLRKEPISISFSRPQRVEEQSHVFRPLCNRKEFTASALRFQILKSDDLHARIEIRCLNPKAPMLLTSSRNMLQPLQTPIQDRNSREPAADNSEHNRWLWQAFARSVRDNMVAELIVQALREWLCWLAPLRRTSSAYSKRLPWCRRSRCASP